MKERTRRQKAIIRRRIFIGILSVLLAVVIALLSLVIGAIVKNSNSKDNDSSSQTQSDANSDDVSSQQTPKDITATVLNTGDVLIHDNILWGAI